MIQGCRRPRTVERECYVASVAAPDHDATTSPVDDDDLSFTERAWVERELALRRRAAALALELGLDESEVYHQM